MNKLKTKLIHLLGGLTEEDIMLRTKPVRVNVSMFNISTLKICLTIRPDMAKLHPDYMNIAKKDMAYKLADKMMEDALIEFSSRQESPERTVMTALAKVVIPLEVGE